MKKTLIFSIVAMLVLSLGYHVDATPAKKKKKKPVAEAVVDSTGGSGTGSTSGSSSDGSSNSGTTATTAVVDTPKSQGEAKKSMTINTLNDSNAYNIEGLVADTTSVSQQDWSLDTSRPIDGFYYQTMLKGARPFPFPDEKIDNIKKYKRIYRVIERKDTIQNSIFFIPGQTLMAAFLDAIKQNKIVAYEKDDFKKVLNYDKVMGKLTGDSVLTPLFSMTGEDSGSIKLLVPFNPENVVAFEIKEDIYFDKIRGKVITEIISIAPRRPIKVSGDMALQLGDGGVFDHPFYLNFKQCRKLLAAREVTDLTRDISNISYDDIFIAHNFKSTIFKEESPSGLDIKSKFPKPEDQAREAARIEREIKDFKRGMFKFY